MPQSTNKFFFENKVFGGCQLIAEQFFGSHEMGCGFTLYVDANGKIILFMSNNLKNISTAALTGKYGSIFFDPFDAPVYTFIHWSTCSRQMIERALKIHFEEHDFTTQDVSGNGHSIPFPTEHGVMF